MAANDDAIRIIAKFEGEEEAKRLAAALSLSTQKFEALYKSLGPTDQATRTAAASVAHLSKQLDTTRASTQGAGQSLMQMGYAADDLQYGFKGIANNIQPILQTLPGLGQMAPILSVAAIAAYQLYTHWDQVMDLFGVGIPQPALKGPELLAANLKKATDEMEELQKKTRLTWYELERLGKLKIEIGTTKEDLAAAKAVEDAAEQKSEQEKEVGGGFAKAMAETGGKNARDEILGQLQNQKDAKGLVYNEAKGRMDTPENAARDMTAAALSGDKISRDAISKMLFNNSRFKANIDKYSPETKKQKEQDDRVKEAEQDAQEEVSKLTREEDKARAAKSKEMTRPLQERYNALAAQGQTPDRAGVKRQLLKGGATEAEAETMADSVLKEFQDGFSDALRKKAGERGLDNAGARAAILQDYQEKSEKDATEQGKKALGGTDLDGRIDRALLRSALKSGGKEGVAQKEVAEQISKALQARGMAKDQADLAGDNLARDHAAKLGDEVNEMASTPRHREAPGRIASADFARSVEAAGAKDAAKLQGSVDKMKEDIAEIVRLKRRGARLQ